MAEDPAAPPAQLARDAGTRSSPTPPRSCSTSGSPSRATRPTPRMPERARRAAAGCCRGSRCSWSGSSGARPISRCASSCARCRRSPPRPRASSCAGPIMGARRARRGPAARLADAAASGSTTRSIGVLLLSDRQLARDVGGADGAQRDRRADRGHRPALDPAARRPAAGRPALDAARVDRDGRRASPASRSWRGPRASVERRRTGSRSSALQVACLSWTVGSLYAQQVPKRLPLASAAAIEMLAGSAGHLRRLAALRRGLVAAWPRPRSRAWGAVGYLVVFGSLVGFTAFAYCLNELPATHGRHLRLRQPRGGRLPRLARPRRAAHPRPRRRRRADRALGRAHDAAQARPALSRAPTQDAARSSNALETGLESKPIHSGRAERAGATPHPPGYSFRSRTSSTAWSRALAQDEVGAVAGRQDVLQQVRLVDLGPDAPGRRRRLRRR